MLLESLDGREEFEDHEEDEDEAGQDDGVDVSLDADDIRKGVTEVGEEDDSDHTTPDDEADAELEEGLVVFAFEKVADSLIQHESRQNEDDDLVEL